MKKESAGRRLMAYGVGAWSQLLCDVFAPLLDLLTNEKAADDPQNPTLPSPPEL
jgi:hypothetical protein